MPTNHPLIRLVRSILGALVILVGTLGRAVAVSPDIDLERVKSNTSAMGNFASRMVGSEGHRHSQDLILSEVRKLPNVQVWTQDFEVVVPRTLESSLTVSGGTPETIYPIWHSGARLQTTPAEGLSGRMVYVGQGTPGEIPVKSVADQIAIMEITGGKNWTGVAAAGARAIILLGSKEETNLHYESHITQLPIHMPRFYLPEGNMAAELRGSGRNSREGTIRSRGEWKSLPGKNIHVLLPSKGDAFKGNPAICIAVPYDGMSLVPDLAPGAHTAMNAAYALELARQFSSNPAHRPILLSWIDAYGHCAKGMRELLLSLAAPQKNVENELFEIRGVLKDYQHVKALADEVGSDLANPRLLADKRFKPIHTYIKHQVSLFSIPLEEQLQSLRLKRYQNPQGAEKARIEEQITTLEAEKSVLLSAQKQLMKGNTNPSTQARRFWKTTHETIGDHVRDTQAWENEWLRREKLKHEIQRALDIKKQATLPITFVLGLYLSDSAPFCGPLAFCGRQGRAGISAEFRGWLENTFTNELKTAPEKYSAQAILLEALSPLNEHLSYNPSLLPEMTSIAQSFRMQGATWATLESLRLREDTPWDRTDLLDWNRLYPQMQATFALLNRLAADDSFKPAKPNNARWSKAPGFVLDRAPGSSVADVPMSNYLVTTVTAESLAGDWRVHDLPHTPGMRALDFQFSKSDGRFRFEAHHKAFGQVQHHARILQAYRFNSESEIIRSNDGRNLASRGAEISYNLRSNHVNPLRLTVFTSREVSLMGLFDPRYLSSLEEGSILDAQKGNELRQGNVLLNRGFIAAQLPLGVDWELILRAGYSRNRMLLLNLQKSPGGENASLRARMKGFSPSQGRPDNPWLIAASDFHELDAIRMGQYRRAGISSKTLDDLHGETEALLNASIEFRENDQGAEFVRATTAALSNEVRVYQSVKETANDVIRAVIFLLLLIIPLSFCLERLFLGSAHVYNRIIGTVIIFCVLTAVLWSFHPAFKITSQPMIIIMAFGILLMSIMVMSMVFSKFETSIEEIRSGRAESSGAKVSLASTIMVAIQLGIANMRKRLLRTVLTGITVMLITFVLLCFTSSSTIIGQKDYDLEVSSPYTGVLLQLPSQLRMEPESLPLIQSAVEKDQQVIPRYWWLNPSDIQWRINLTNPSTLQRTQAVAALGLDPREGSLTGIQRWCQNWEEFSKGEGCYLPKDIASELGVKAGDSVMITGQLLKVLGVFEQSNLDREWKDLDGNSMLPLDFSMLEASERGLLKNRDLSVLVGGGLGSAADNLPRSSASGVIILPTGMMRGHLSTLQSIAVKTQEEPEAKELARKMARRFEFPIYFSTANGTRLIATTPLLPATPKNIIIPLLIAGLIIFNTMLSSISERKREIHIYNSLGLAPLHVGFLFLAEAITYGLMGSVFGYVFGQGAATLLSNMGLLGGITLNYSGTHAIFTMLLVLVVVVVSSAIPAFLAGKLAAPSNRMTWTIPKPVNGVITDTLPFTVTPHTANAVASYIFDYLKAHREGGLGHFTTGKIHLIHSDPEQKYHGVEATIWLAPYDLAVRQNIRFLIRQSDEPGILEIHLELQHQSGQEDTWWKLNRNFIGGMRKQLLGWRNLKKERIEEYIHTASTIQVANTPEPQPA